MNQEDLKEAIELALPHRMRRRPFEEPRIDPEHLDDLMNQPPHENSGEMEETPKQPQEQGEKKRSSKEEPLEEQDNRDDSSSSKGNSSQEQRVFGIGSPIDPSQMKLPDNQVMKKRYAPGRRFETAGEDHRGRYIGAEKRSSGE